MDIGKIEFGPITKLKEDWSAVHGAAMAIDETVSVLTSNLCVCEHPFSRHTVAPSNAVDDYSGCLVTTCRCAMFKELK